MASNSTKDDANAQFKKAQRAEDGKKAMSEYEAEVMATRAKTARLRALRLERDAADQAAAAAAPPAPKKKGAKAKKAAGGTLSGYLDDRKKSGRDT